MQQNNSEALGKILGISETFVRTARQGGGDLLRQATTALISARYGRDRYVALLRDQFKVLKLIIGAGETRYAGWIPTDLPSAGTRLPLPGRVIKKPAPLDITDVHQWSMLFDKGTVSNMLCEHVFEHLDNTNLIQGLKLCWSFLEPGGRLRIAVPDGRRPDAKYIKLVAPPADGHVQFFTIESLSELLKSLEFAVEPLEYYNISGEFVRNTYNEDDGIVLRSSRRDKRMEFAFADHHYTSLIVDAVRPS